MYVIWNCELLLPVARLSEPYLKIRKQSERECVRERGTEIKYTMDQGQDTQMPAREKTFSLNKST